jgi:hypothetical protein
MKKDLVLKRPQETKRQEKIGKLVVIGGLGALILYHAFCRATMGPEIVFAGKVVDQDGHLVSGAKVHYTVKKKADFYQPEKGWELTWGADGIFSVGRVKEDGFMSKARSGTEYGVELTIDKIVKPGYRDLDAGKRRNFPFTKENYTGSSLKEPVVFMVEWTGKR